MLRLLGICYNGYAPNVRGSCGVGTTKFLYFNEKFGLIEDSR